MIKLAVVILNWNGEHYLKTFLPTLLKNLPHYAEVIIADNASTDGSITYVQQQFPALRIIQNYTNQGFAEGYNTALRQIKAEYYCLLNSDIEVTPQWIEPIINFFETHAEVAVIQPKLLSYYKRNTFEYAGACGGYIDKYGYPFCRGRLFDIVEEDNGQYNEPCEIFWATGAALFVRSSVYHQLGGLDPDFFAHMEEIDFCWRVKNHGHSIWVVPQSIVYHVGGGTLPKNNAFKTYLNFRNNLYLLLKNLPSKRIIPTLFVKFFLDQIAAFFFLLQGHFQDFCAVYRAMWHFYKHRKKTKQKREKDLTQAYTQLYPKSIVWAHYALRKKHFNGDKLF